MDRRPRPAEYITPSTDETVSLFRDLVSRADADIHLAAAALAIARLRYPDLDMAYYLEELAAIGRDACLTLSRYPQTDPVAMLNVLLFEEHGFDGDRDNYYDPRNCLLNDVLDRRLGIPVTLALVYIEAGRAAGVEICGVGFPGHFLVCHPVSGSYIDVYNQGRLLDRAAFVDLLRRQGVGPDGWRDAFLQPVGRAQILARLLNNLRRHYAQEQDGVTLVAVASMLQSLESAREPGFASMIQ